MALRFLEGFETHQTLNQWTRKYSTFTGTWGINPGNGRVFGQAGSIAATVAIPPAFPLADTWGVAFGLRLNAQVAGLNSGAQGLYFEKGGTEQVHLEIQSNSGSFEIRLMRGATQLAITSAAYAYNIWHHFELKVTINTSTGSYELRHNEVTAFGPTSGVNTANAGSNQASEFAHRFTTTSTNVLFDDVFIWDGTGSHNNNFLGDTVIEGVTVNGNGATQQWTRAAGASNALMVDDPGSSSPVDTNDFNSSDTNTQEDLYTYTDLANITGFIIGVQLDTQMAMASAGSRVVTTRFRDPSTTEADISDKTVSSTTYASFADVMDVNPQDGLGWDVADVNGGQFGVKVKS